MATILQRENDFAGEKVSESVSALWMSASIFPYWHRDLVRVTTISVSAPICRAPHDTG